MHCWARAFGAYMDSLIFKSQSTAQSFCGFVEMRSDLCSGMRFSKGVHVYLCPQHPILMKWHRKALPLDVFNLPAVRAVVSWKWHRWAKNAVLIEFILYVLWMVSFMVFALTYEVRVFQEGATFDRGRISYLSWFFH